MVNTAVCLRQATPAVSVENRVTECNTVVSAVTYQQQTFNFANVVVLLPEYLTIRYIGNIMYVCM